MEYLNEPKTSASGPVIVVEDDEAVRSALAFALRLEGFDVVDYGGAFDLLADRKFPIKGCLVIDYHMPLVDGIDLLQCLRSRSILIPAILLTDKITNAVRTNATRAGFLRVLEKPLDDSSLVDSIRAALAR